MRISLGMRWACSLLATQRAPNTLVSFTQNPKRPQQRIGSPDEPTSAAADCAGRLVRLLTTAGGLVSVALSLAATVRTHVCLRQLTVRERLESILTCRGCLRVRVAKLLASLKRKADRTSDGRLLFANLLTRSELGRSISAIVIPTTANDPDAHCDQPTHPQIAQEVHSYSQLALSLCAFDHLPQTLSLGSSGFVRACVYGAHPAALLSGSMSFRAGARSKRSRNVAVQ